MGDDLAYDFYLYGMILRTNSFLLEGDYPAPDTYAEIRAKYSLPGGETGTCATVLLSLGRSVKMDGTYMGRSTMPFIRDFYKDKKCDLSSLHLDESFDGLEDNVLVAGNTRTPLGQFRAFYGDKIHRWNPPREADIAGAKVAALDPYFFGDAVRAAAYNPARVLGIDRRYGTLEPGKAANLVVLDAELNVKAVFFNGAIAG